MAEGQVHLIKAKVTIPAVGYPYWETRCGLSFAGEVALAITDDRKNATCPKCKKVR